MPSKDMYKHSGRKICVRKGRGGGGFKKEKEREGEEGVEGGEVITVDIAIDRVLHCTDSYGPEEGGHHIMS